MLLKCGIHKVNIFFYQNLPEIEFNSVNVYGCQALCGRAAMPVAEFGNFQEEFLIIRESLIMPGVGNVFGSCLCLIFNDKLLLF